MTRILARLRARLRSRRAAQAARLEEQAKLRRDLESHDHSLAEATRVQQPPGSPSGGPF